MISFKEVSFKFCHSFQFLSIANLLKQEICDILLLFYDIKTKYNIN